MRRKADAGRLLVLTGMMLAAALVFILLEGTDAKAHQYADVEIFEADGKRYLFLPSWADREEEAVRHEGEDVEIMQSQNLASIEIETRSGSLDYISADKENGEPGRMTVMLADGSEAYEGVIEEIRTRGNSTWSLPKKAFQVRLLKKADLFGMGAAKTWILLANGFDETGIRNTIAFEMADSAGLAYTPESEPVDLYCNGEYQGSYLLCEKVQAGAERADIKEGFLIERELQDRYEVAVYLEGRSGFMTDRGDCFLIESPKEPRAWQTEWIRELVQAAEDAVHAVDGIHPKTQKKWSDYLDLDSFVRKYLLEEVTKNYDGGVTSAFYYVPEGEEKLYAGPVWDYDLIFGNVMLDEMNSDPRGVTKLSNHTLGSGFYSALMEQEEFRNAVFQCFKEVYLPLLKKLLEEDIDRYAGRTEESIRMDHVRWKDMDNRYQYYESYEDNLRYLKYYVEKRTDFLKEVWLDGEIYRTVTLVVEENDWRKFYVKDGGLLGELPVPFLNDHLFMGWYRSDGKKYDPYRPVYEDMLLEAKWQAVAGSETYNK